jgi:class 3 adenylate cyclase/predicted ATPase
MRTCPRCGEENPERAGFCNACGAALAVEEGAGVRKTVTVLFCDLVGSTALADRADPEVLRELMARYHRELRTILERHGGSVEKFVGDAAMAVFGIPKAHEDDALRATRAASEIRDKVGRLGLEARIGVNTGEVVAGHGETLVTGDAVNVAARLEQAASPGEVLLGEGTHVLVRDAVDDEVVEPLVLKGKAQPVPAYRLHELRPDVPALTRPLDAPFVGREDDLETLARVLGRAVEERTPQLATIIGPPGIGKSRLAGEFIQRSRARVLVGRCLSYGEGITYLPLAEVISQVGELRSALGGHGDAELAASRIAGAVGTGAEASSPEEIAWAFRRLFEALARERPLTVVLDDIHWAEPTLLDLIEYVSTFAREAPFVLLCLARPDVLELRPSWLTPKPNATLVNLEPLAEGQAEMLVDELSDVSDETKARIVDAAGGNPLFLEQFLAAESERGSGALEIPPSIHALLAARMDSLAPEERSVIERASVEGSMFHRGSVAELVPEQSRPRVGSHLMTLIRKGLIRPDLTTLPGDDGFRFAHVLIRDAAYDSIPKRIRADLHERFANFMLSRLGADAPSEILGYHLEQAYRYSEELQLADEQGRGLGRRAAGLLSAAGRRALVRGDSAAAANLLARSVELLPAEDVDRLELLPDLGWALTDTGDLARAEEVLAEAEAGGPLIQGQALVRRLWLRSNVDASWSEAEAEEKLAEAIVVFEQSGDELGLARSFNLLAYLNLGMGRSSRARELAERAIRHAARAGDRREEAQARDTIGGTHVWGATPAEEVIRECRKLLKWAREQGDRPLEADALAFGLAVPHAMLGHFEQARRLIREGLELVDELGRLRHSATIVSLGAVVELLAEEPAKAERELRTALQTLDRIGELGHKRTAAQRLAYALCEQGRYDEAEQAAAVSESAGSDLETEPYLRGIRARLLARRGGFAEAEELAREAIALVEETDFVNIRADTRMDLADVLEVSGKKDEAASVVEEAIRLYERKGNVVSAGRARKLLSELSAPAS